MSKGFYDEWPGTTPGSEVIDNENEQVDDTVTDIMQIVSVNLTFPTVRSLPSPSSLGILLIFNVIGGLGSVDIDTTYGGGAPYAKVLRNEIEYILFTFNTIGQTVTLLSIPEDVGVGHRWLCIDATSSVTWTT